MVENSKVVVTGAGGFIGSHLTEQLVLRGAKVKALVHYNSQGTWGNLELVDKEVLKNLEVVTGDITDPFFCRDLVKNSDIVFHLAALIAIPFSYKAPHYFVQTNIIGTLNILQACLEHNISNVVHTSTSEVYGTALYTPIDEKHPLHGQSPYSASKIGADKLAESFYCSFGLPVKTIRPFNTFGPRQSARAIIPAIVCQALTGEKIYLGNPKPVRDLNYVLDVVNGFIKVAELQGNFGEAINIGSGKAISVGDLVKLIGHLLHRTLEVVSADERMRPEKSEVYQLVCDNSKARRIVGWQPNLTLEEGILQTADWFRINLHRYKPGLYNI